MTMSNKELVELLSTKAELSDEEVENNLRQLREYLSSELQNKQACTLEGLGTFSVQDGELNFTPDPKLAAEINHTYAGMKPIELIGAYKEMSDIVKSDADKQEDVPAEIPADSGVEKYQEPIVAGDESDFDAEGEEAEPLETKAEEEQEPEAAAPEETEGNREDEESVSESDPTPDTDVPETEAVPKVETGEETGDPIGKWLIAAVIVIGLGLGGWLIYDMGFSGNSNQDPVSQASAGQTVAQADSDPGDGSSTNSDDGNDDVSGGESNEAGKVPSESEQDDQNSISEDTRVAEESRQSIYGLRGGATPEVSDGYTIVVHSLRDEAKVRRVNNELQQQGYRTIVYSANVMDTTFWRLGLGQFKTVDDALEAAATLPGRYRDNHFIKRIQ